jgi:hypothetical protein
MSNEVNDDRSSDRAVLLAQRLVGLLGALAATADSGQVADQLIAGCSELLDVDGVSVVLSDGADPVSAAPDPMAQCLPLRHGADSVGTLHLLRADHTPLSASDLAIAEALAGAAAFSIVHRRQLAEALTRSEQLQGALDTRIVVEQATGVLSEYAGIGMGAAFDAMRQHARSHRLKLSSVAERLVTRQLTPGEVIPGRRS